MITDSETLRHRRMQILLRNGHYFWWSTLLVSVACMAFQLLNDPTQSGVLNIGTISILALLGWWTNGYCRRRLSEDPLWSPLPLITLVITVNALLWSAVAGRGGMCLTLAIAEAGLAGIFLYSHGRLLAITVGAIGLIPIPFLFQAGNPLLAQVHLPLMALFSMAAVLGHRWALHNIRNELESLRLTRLLTENQADLQTKINQRTHEIEQINHRLNREVELRKEVNLALIQSEEQVNLAMTASGIGFWDWDLERHKVYHSDAQQFFGNIDSIAGKEFALTDYIVPDDMPIVRTALKKHLRGETDYYQARYRIELPNSLPRRWIEDIGKITERNNRGRAIRMIGTRRDVSKDMQLQEDLSLSSSLFNNSADGVFVLDDQQQFRTCNRAFCQIFTRQTGELVGMPLFQVIRTDQANRIAQNILNNGRYNGDIVAARNKTERFPLALTLTAIRRKDNSVSHYLGICRDQSEATRSDIEVRQLNNYDKLTGLFNRAYFHQVLHQFREHVPLQQDHYAVCVLNLDRFKSINESLGLDVGDQLLRDLAARLSNSAAPIRQVARLSSDEFALVIEYEHKRDKLLHTLAHLQAEITRPFLVEEHELIVTASIGVCIVQEGNLIELLNHAIAAMNQARYQGGNNFQFYHQRLATTPVERVQMEKAMRIALAHNEFSVNYQPKLNLHSGLIDSVEALVRWIHPQKGLIDPQDFIPLAEENGLISAIGEQVLNKACQDAADWRKRCLGDISISVNLSSHQIRRDDLYDVVSNALRNSDLPAKYLELELTESMLMEDINHAQDFLNQLRSLGVRLALDDFGTGYSSLSYLKRLPIDTLKIDKSFVAEARQGEPSPIVEAILAMADSLKLSVVAEGVETKEQLAYLEKLGCDYAQGYLISRALPASEILPLIRHANLGSRSQVSDSVH
ncbi:putative bifunctional diguanylate cyclase/phosphodiesterase [Reinekea sp.]|jgi:diguanylate cyclase (GGDEF)-like protein/PAS domain S-box-containing protein|uniref:putative bifunctional diguanylate cyclase/phosphodiesterase n=1 Tax=Reinekea sp. TaxID=1970455 RepID=UPI002A7F5B8C|nr:EAL domain-containing protein [Reinekea sp.]